MKILNKSGEEVKDLDFGIVNVGDTENYEYWLYNDNGTKVIKIRLDFATDERDLKIIDHPKTLKKEERGSIKIKWTPSLRIKKGLKNQLKINAVELWS